MVAMVACRNVLDSLGVKWCIYDWMKLYLFLVSVGVDCNSGSRGDWTRGPFGCWVEGGRYVVILGGELTASLDCVVLDALVEKYDKQQQQQQHFSLVP